MERNQQVEQAQADLEFASAMLSEVLPNVEGEGDTQRAIVLGSIAKCITRANEVLRSLH